ncbi:MAG TPA: 50S ribosomal protein L19 [Clostridiales bacterium]|nr:50S ribosomal protein L19 [Clostridiales bacterium]
MNTVIETIGKEAMKENTYSFKVGDTVKVHIKFKEITRGGAEANKSKNARTDKTVKEEIKSQTFEGLVIARRGGGISETFTVRKISYGVGVEKTFMLHSPQIESIEVTRQGAVRRSKLYYMRGRTGKAAKVKAAK